MGELIRLEEIDREYRRTRTRLAERAHLARAVAVMKEIGLDISNHKPWTVEDLEDWEGLSFDLIVTLSPEAHHKALQLTTTSATEVEYWPTPDPVGVEGRRELQLDAYRHVRDSLRQRIRERFGSPGMANE